MGKAVAMACRSALQQPGCTLQPNNAVTLQVVARYAARRPKPLHFGAGSLQLTTVTDLGRGSSRTGRLGLGQRHRASTRLEHAGVGIGLMGESSP
jgi:hypothetical protein